LKTATSELRTLFERFANGQSMNMVFGTANALIDDANKDAELRQWFKSLNAYIHKVRSHACIHLLWYLLADVCTRFLVPGAPPSGNHICD
jgi:hypothetical protein